MLLKRRDINPNQIFINNGLMPLLLATIIGHEGIVKTLLEREDVNPNQPDTIYGQTPLVWAATKGHEGVVRMFLDRNVGLPIGHRVMQLSGYAYTQVWGYGGMRLR